MARCYTSLRWQAWEFQCPALLFAQKNIIPGQGLLAEEEDAHGWFVEPGANLAWILEINSRRCDEGKS